MPITRRHWRRVEAPYGTGMVYDGDRYLATVDYRITVLQEIVGTRHWSGSSAVQGQRKTSGRLQVMHGNLPFEDDHLTLRLDDGRSLSFFAVGAGPDYTIDPTGSLS